MKQELKPLEVNGVTAVTLGTIAWTITLVIFLLAQNWLADTGRSHWTLIALSGVGLGLFGYRYTTNRVKHINGNEPVNQSELIQDFE